jgi:uncharacterized protein
MTNPEIPSPSRLMAAFASVFTSLALVVSMPSAASAKVLDCPLREERFSVDLPMIDILLSPAASATVDRLAPGMVQNLPPIFRSTTAPAFGSIMTLRMIASSGLAGGRTVNIDALNSELGKLPVTADDRRARCARYDDDLPRFTMPRGKLRVLLFEKMTGFRDGPSVDAAASAIRDLAAKRGWALVETDKGGVMRPDVLKRFNVVVWNNVSGDVLTLTQRAAFKAYIEHGGGYVGVHGSAGDPATFWPWYIDELVGARFKNHPSNPQFQEAEISIESTNQALTQGLPAKWKMTDEWYSFVQSARLTGSKVLATLDEKSYSPGINPFSAEPVAMGADHPIVWTRCVGKGRSFYSAIGHVPETYSDSRYSRLLINAVEWAGGTHC